MEQWRTKMQLRKEKRMRIKAKKDRDKVRKNFSLCFENLLFY